MRTEAASLSNWKTKAVLNSAWSLASNPIKTAEGFTTDFTKIGLQGEQVTFT